MWTRLYSLLLLTWGMIRSLARLLVPRKSGLVRFEEQYGSEGLLAVAPEDAALLARPTACTACGKCDQFEGQRIAESTVGYRGIMAFVLSGTRSMPDAQMVARSLSELDDAHLRRAQELCPERVPIVELAHFVRRQAARMDRTR